MSISCASMNSSNDSEWIRDNHDYADVSNVSVTSPYKSAVIQYIAGYVVRMVRKRVNCPVCVSAEAGETLHPSSDTRIEAG